MRNINDSYSALSELRALILRVPSADAIRCAQRLALAIIFRAFGAVLISSDFVAAVISSD